MMVVYSYSKVTITNKKNKQYEYMKQETSFRTFGSKAGHICETIIGVTTEIRRV